VLEFCSKFHNLSSSEIILKISYVLGMLQQVKPGVSVFWDSVDLFNSFVGNYVPA